jgi:hypothetical protein
MVANQIASRTRFCGDVPGWLAIPHSVVTGNNARKEMK